MDRVNVYRYEPIGRGKEYAGWYDDDAVTERVKEASDWNGNNHIGRSSGLQTSRQLLIRTAAGRWVRYTDARHEFDGPLTVEFVTDHEARDWLLTNSEEDLAEKYFGPQDEERPDLEVMARQWRQAEKDFKEEAVKQHLAGHVTKSDIHRWSGVARNTIDTWFA